jgi:hypothetical protein
MSAIVPHERVADASLTGSRHVLAEMSPIICLRIAAILATGAEITVAGLNNAIVEIRPLDDGGDVPVKIDLWKGYYEVRLSFYCLATADPQGAVSLALQQLAALPGS